MARQEVYSFFPLAPLLVDGLYSSIKGIREGRDGIDSRHRLTTDDSSRFGPSRDRQGMERHFTDQVPQVSPAFNHGNH